MRPFRTAFFETTVSTRAYDMAFERDASMSMSLRTHDLGALRRARHTAIPVPLVLHPSDIYIYFTVETAARKIKIFK